MENSNEKIFIANLKTSEKFGDDILQGALNISQLQLFIDKYAYSVKGSDQQFVNIKIVKRKNASEFNHTHYIEIDTFKPERQEKKKSEVTAE